MASSGVRGRARQEDTGDTGPPRIGDRPERGGPAAAARPMPRRREHKKGDPEPGRTSGRALTAEPSSRTRPLMLTGGVMIARPGDLGR